MEKRRWRRGRDALGRDATFPWSRELTHPPRSNRKCIKGSSEVERSHGSCPKSDGGHIVFHPLFGFRDVINLKRGPILPTRHYQLMMCLKWQTAHFAASLVIKCSLYENALTTSSRILNFDQF